MLLTHKGDHKFVVTPHELLVGGVVGFIVVWLIFMGLASVLVGRMGAEDAGAALVMTFVPGFMAGVVGVIVMGRKKDQ